jgi:hypothetical protein
LALALRDQNKAAKPHQARIVETRDPPVIQRLPPCPDVEYSQGIPEVAIMRALTAALVIAGALCGACLSTETVCAQEVVAAAPSDTQAVAAGDVASVAVAQINDQAVAAQAQQKIDLYKQLMELNGESRSIRAALDNTKTATRLIVLQRAGSAAMTTDQDAKYNAIADQVLAQAEGTIIDETAASQSQSFSLDEIQQLINANSSVAAAKYNASKFVEPQDNADQIQSLMVAAVVKIITTFKESVAS